MMNQKPVFGLSLALGVALFSPSCFGAAPASAELPHISDIAFAHETTDAPIIDGRLDEACWQVGELLTNFSIAGKPDVPGAAGQTEAVLTYDADNLYVGARLSCADTSRLVAVSSIPNKNSIFDDDVFEVFLDPGLTRKDGYHVAVNARGTIYFSGPNEKAMTGVSAKSVLDGKIWSIELAIPFRLLGARPGAGKTWGLNLAREDKLVNRNTSWSRLGTPSFVSWSQFGNLRFGAPADVQIHFPQPLTIGATGDYPVVLRGGSRKTEINVQLEKHPALRGQEFVSQKTSVPAGGVSQVSLDQTLHTGASIGSVVQARKIVRVLDGKSGLLLAQAAITDDSDYEAGAIIRDTPTTIRADYLKEHPEWCTQDKRSIYNGAVYISPDHVTMRSLTFFHNSKAGLTLEGPQFGFRVVYEAPQGVEVTALALIGGVTLRPDSMPKVENIELNGKPAKRFTFDIPYIQNLPEGEGIYMAYFKTNLPAGSEAFGTYHLEWKGGSQKPQPIRFKSISIPKVKAPRRFFIMPWGLPQGHVQLLAPNFPADYTSLGMNMIGFYYMGHFKDKAAYENGLKLSESLATKAKTGQVMSVYNEFFPWTPDTEYGMVSWMKDPDAWAYDAAGKPISSWLSGHAPCPSYRGKYYQKAVSDLANSEQLRRVPANFFSMDTEYYGSKGTELCFCPRCVGQFEVWFKKKFPATEYIDPFTIQANTQRSDPETGKYEIATKYPVQHKAWVEFKIEQYSDLIGGFKQAIAKSIGKAKTSQFDKLTFADWAAVYPSLLEQEGGLFGPYSIDHSIDLYATGVYGPPAFLSRPRFSEIISYYQDVLGRRQTLYDTPATSGAWTSAYYAHSPEVGRYYLLESAMNGVQGFLLYGYNGLEGKQLQVNAQVFGSFSLVDDLITQGKRMKNLKMTGKEMHARGLQIGREKLILAGDYYVATDRRSGVLTCPVEERMPVYDLLQRKKIGELTPQKNTITLTIDGLNDRARFLYVGNNWQNRLKGNF